MIIISFPITLSFIRQMLYSPSRIYPGDFVLSSSTFPIQLFGNIRAPATDRTQYFTKEAWNQLLIIAVVRNGVIDQDCLYIMSTELTKIVHDENYM